VSFEPGSPGSVLSQRTPGERLSPSWKEVKGNKTDTIEGFGESGVSSRREAGAGFGRGTLGTIETVHRQAGWWHASSGGSSKRTLHFSPLFGFAGPSYCCAIASRCVPGFQPAVCLPCFGAGLCHRDGVRITNGFIDPGSETNSLPTETVLSTRFQRLAVSDQHSLLPSNVGTLSC
jgi:hypothetical protein